MGRRTWIDSDIWRDTRKLTKEELDLYLRLLVNEGGNIAGYYRLNIQHLASDMKLTEDEVTALLSHKNKYWLYDPDTEQVLLPRYTKYNMVRGAPQIKKLNAELAALTPCHLHKEFLRAWSECNGLGSENLLQEQFKRWCN